MKLKRYVLLDNNRIVDLKVEADHKIDRIAYLGKPLLIGNKDFGKIIATSDDATDFIRENDLVRYEDYNGVLIVGEVEEVEDIRNNWVLLETKILPKNRIVTIYKLIGDDYICVWKKEEV